MGPWSIHDSNGRAIADDLRLTRHEAWVRARREARRLGTSVFVVSPNFDVAEVPNAEWLPVTNKRSALSGWVQS